MIRLKRRTSLTALFVIFLSASFASVQTSLVSYVGVSGTTGPENCGVFYESGGIVALGCVAWTTNSDGLIRVFRESPSIVGNRLNKEAEKTLRSEQRSTWRAYVAEHRRSMTDGGKSSKISSPYLLKDWCDALSPVYFS